MGRSSVPQRFVIFNFSLGKFFQSAGLWTDDSLGAFDFKDETGAAKAGREMAHADHLVVVVTTETGELIKGTRVTDYPFTSQDPKQI
jgi:hypothetical protein